MTDPRNVKVHHAFHDNSTPNLIQHVRSCKGPDDDDEPQLVQSSLMPFVQGSTYTAGHLRTKHIKWVAQHHHPYAIIEDDVYLEILHIFNKDIKVFSADTLSCDVEDVYNVVKLQVAVMLQVCSQSFNLQNALMPLLRT